MNCEVRSHEAWQDVFDKTSTAAFRGRDRMPEGSGEVPGAVATEFALVGAQDGETGDAVGADYACCSGAQPQGEARRVSRPRPGSSFLSG